MRRCIGINFLFFLFCFARPLLSFYGGGRRRYCFPLVLSDKVRISLQKRFPRRGSFLQGFLYLLFPCVHVRSLHRIGHNQSMTDSNALSMVLLHEEGIYNRLDIATIGLALELFHEHSSEFAPKRGKIRRAGRPPLPPASDTLHSFS